MLDWLRNLLGESDKLKTAQRNALRDLNYMMVELDLLAGERTRLKQELGLLRAEVSFQVQAAQELGFALDPKMSSTSAISALLHEIAPLAKAGSRYLEAQARGAARKKAERAKKHAGLVT